MQYADSEFRRDKLLAEGFKLDESQASEEDLSKLTKAEPVSYTHLQSCFNKKRLDTFIRVKLDDSQSTYYGECFFREEIRPVVRL